MICPTCGHDNLPGVEECKRCLQDLTQLDRPVGHDVVERSLLEDPVSILQPIEPVTVPVSATLHDAMEAMRGPGVGAVLVVDDNGKLLGIFSERDLLNKVAGIHDNYAELPVRRFMTANPETVAPSDTLALALHKMDIGGYRHLPVVVEQRPVAMLSVRAMLRHIRRLCKDA